ncbi:MAG: (2Fe-2S)-binding protein, partial [Promethearchaeota archaeon]
VTSVTIGQLDDNWKVIEGTEKTFECDTILVAVGLAPVDEFYLKAKTYNIPVWVAGDAQEIAEASAAIFTGRVEAAKILKDMGIDSGLDLEELNRKAAIMKARPPLPVTHEDLPKETGVFPIFHCDQEIPCNPCTTVCPQDQIHTENDLITNRPSFQGTKTCLFCGRCVAVCPGLAITVVDYRKDSELPTVMFPYEVATEKFQKGQKITVMDNDRELGEFEVKRAWFLKEFPHTQLVTVQLPKSIAKKAISVKTIPTLKNNPINLMDKIPLTDDAIVCRCERVTAGEIRKWIRKGVTDINQLKAITRAGMGACGGKTCALLVERIMREEGIPPEEITKGVKRPLFVEVPLGTFAGVKKED